MKTKQHTYKAALYMRLSKEDGEKESASIGTQRKMLRFFAKENHFDVYDEYIDDGVSGTTFERPDFQRMIHDIEYGFVNMVITKDLSRLGRDYITAGKYTEFYFPEHGVRYIAINDGYDSINEYNDIAPFKNVINEMYARDTSKKIRSAFQTKMKDGCYIGNFAPYGYMKDPTNKNHLIVDPVTAPVVREMFSMAENGDPPSVIAKHLNDEAILTPALYRCYKHPYLDPGVYTQRREWTSSSVCKMLRNVVYLGHTAQGKTTKVSFKSKITLSNPEDDWIIVKHTHDPIISEEQFYAVRSRSISRKNLPKNGFKNVFSGIAKCMDCGRNMSTTGSRRKGATTNLVCGGYKLYGRQECTNHFIDYDTLYDIVMEEIRKQISFSQLDKQSIIQEVQQQAEEQRAGTENKKKLSLLKARDRELDKIIRRLYEDNVAGKINDNRFNRLLTAYELEQKNIANQIRSLSQHDLPQVTDAYLKFLNLIDDITDVKELTPELLHKLIERIEIGQGYFDEDDEKKEKKRQTIRIYYRFIGSKTNDVIA